MPPPKRSRMWQGGSSSSNKGAGKGAGKGWLYQGRGKKGGQGGKGGGGKTPQFTKLPRDHVLAVYVPWLGRDFCRERSMRPWFNLVEAAREVLVAARMCACVYVHT